MAFSPKQVLLLIETSRAAGRRIIEGITQYVIERQNWSIHLEERHILGTPGWLKTWQGDGIITRTADWETHKILKKKNIPTVELHGDNVNYFIDVIINEPRLAGLAADHLWDQGFRHFAAFGLGNAWWIETRYANFVEAVAKYKAKPFVFQTKDSVHPYPSLIVDDRLMKRIVRWVRNLPKPIGIWGITDMNAFNVLKACHLAGISVPSEVAILGTDNDTLLCNALVPQLSSIDVNAREIGYQAAILLNKRMNGQNAPTPILTEPSHVVVRQSTDIIAIPDPHIARALGYIRDQSASPMLTAAKIARWSGISLRSLQMKFRRHLNSTLEEQVAQCRIAHACRLLRDTNTKISAIPSLVGLSSERYFFVLFRKLRQVTPQTYRHTHRESLEE
jgi:LacI family transcriptional regulator